MNLPLYSHEFFSRPTSMVIGTLTGIAFGFVLERSGFGRAPNLAAQFYGTDMRVFKVMFTGIATAAAGLGLLSGLGVVDVGQLTVPETFLWPQLAGGLLLGVGFIVAGYCPGTAAVATASGHMDGLVTYVGVGLGTLVFGALYPQLSAFYTSGGLGVLRLDQLTGLPFGVVAAAVVAMAIGCFFGAEALERIFTRRNAEAAPVPARPLRNRAFALLASLALVAAGTAGIAQSASATAPKRTGKIDAITLAERIARDPTRLQILDLRPAADCHAQRVPNALCLADLKGDWLATLPVSRDLVVYGTGDVKQLPSAVTRFAGEVVVLQGGFTAFRQAVLDAPVPPTAPTVAQLAAYRSRSALHSHFTGQQAAAPVLKVPSAPAASSAAPAKKGGGC